MGRLLWQMPRLPGALLFQCDPKEPRVIGPRRSRVSHTFDYAEGIADRQRRRSGQWGQSGGAYASSLSPHRDHIVSRPGLIQDLACLCLLRGRYRQGSPPQCHSLRPQRSALALDPVQPAAQAHSLLRPRACHGEADCGIW